MIRITILCAAALLLTGLIGGGWFLLAADSVGYVQPAATVMTITAVVGFGWQRARALTNRRKAVFDAYAERELARLKESSTQGGGAV
jgi:hypothetical protein